MILFHFYTFEDMSENTLLMKRMHSLEKRKEMLREMGFRMQNGLCADIETTVSSIRPIKKEKKKREPVIVDENMRRKSR